MLDFSIKQTEVELLFNLIAAANRIAAVFQMYAAKVVCLMGFDSYP